MSIEREHSPLKARKPSIIERAEAFLVRAEHGIMGTSGKRIRALFYVLRVLVQVVRQWVRDRCPQQAASLAFQTALSIVPVLAVATAALRALGHLNAESRFIGFIADNLIPISREEISEKLASFSGNMTFEQMGMVGLITTVLLAFVMFNNLERVMNYIWRAEKRRSITQKFVVFYFSMTVGPLLVGTSLVEAARFGLTSGIKGALLGLISTAVVAFMANIFLPSTRVRVVPAVAGALVTTIFFESAKFGFSYYVSNFALSKYSGIYGKLAIIPLWLLWVYYSWLILLLGVEVAHAVQNLNTLEGMERRGRLPLEQEMASRVNGVVASRIMVAVADSYLSGRHVISKQTLSDRFDLSEEVTERLLERLADAELIMAVEGKIHGFAPARPPETINLAEVLALFRGDDVDIAQTRRVRTKLDVVLAELERDARERTEALTLADLAATDEPSGAIVRRGVVENSGRARTGDDNGDHPGTGNASHDQPGDESHGGEHLPGEGPADADPSDRR